MKNIFNLIAILMLCNGVAIAQLSTYPVTGTGSGSAGTIPSTTNVICGDGSGNGALCSPDLAPGTIVTTGASYSNPGFVASLSAVKLSGGITFDGTNAHVNPPVGAGLSGLVIQGLGHATTINGTDESMISVLHFNPTGYGWRQRATDFDGSFQLDILRSGVWTTSVITAGFNSVTFGQPATFTGHPTIEGITSTGATGTGPLVFGTSPTLTTPNLGTPSAINLANATNVPASAFSTVTSGTNTIAAMVVGTGASLATTGTGAITATQVPTAAGATATTNGQVKYDTTNNMIHAAQNGADAQVPQFTVTPANNDCAKWTVSGSNYKLDTSGAGCVTAGPTLTAPIQGNWTSFNTTGMAQAPTFASSRFTFESSSQAGNNVQGISSTVPSAPYTRYFRLWMFPGPKAFSSTAVGWSDGTKYVICGVETASSGGGSFGPAQWLCSNYTNTTTVSGGITLSAPLSNNETAAIGQPVWIRVVDNSTNWTVSFSIDSTNGTNGNYLQIMTEARNTFLTATQLVVVVSGSGSSPTGVVFDSFQ